MSPNQGWYADPTGRHARRYWDGRRWTDDVADGNLVTTDEIRSPEELTASARVEAVVVPSEPQSLSMRWLVVPVVVGTLLAIAGLVVVLVVAIGGSNSENGSSGSGVFSGETVGVHRLELSRGEAVRFRATADADVAVALSVAPEVAVAGVRENPAIYGGAVDPADEAAVIAFLEDGVEFLDDRPAEADVLLGARNSTDGAGYESDWFIATTDGEHTLLVGSVDGSSARYEIRIEKLAPRLDLDEPDVLADAVTRGFFTEPEFYEPE